MIAARLPQTSGLSEYLNTVINVSQVMIPIGYCCYDINLLQCSEWLWCCLFYQVLSGWWCQTFFIFHNIWDKPSHWLSYFARWLKPPTIYIYIHYVYIITHHISLYSIITHDIPMVFGEFPGGLQLNSCSQALHPTWACASFGWPRFGDAVNVE